MKKKYKFKRRNKFKLSFVFILLIIFCFFISFGYALLSDNLKITGIANIKEPVDELPKDCNMTIKPLGTNSYVTVLFPNVSFSFVEDTFSGNLLTTKVKKTDETSNVTFNISFNFTNESGYDYSNGVVKSEIIGDASAIGEVKPYASSAVWKGTGGMFSTYIPVNPTEIKQETTIKFTITYTVNGETRGFVYKFVIVV